MLVDEPDVYRDHARWLAAVHRGRRLPTDALRAQFDGLEEALGDDGRVHALIAAGRVASGLG